MKLNHFTIVVVSAIGFLLTSIGLSWPSRNLQIVMCDVGQGDAILIIDGFHQVMIDGGPDERVMDCLRSNLPWWDRSLELVIATHPDADHIGGLPALLQGYLVQTLLIDSVVKDTAPFQALRQAILEEKKQGLLLIEPRLGLSYQLSQRVHLTVLSPEVGLNEAVVWQPGTTETTLSAVAQAQDQNSIDANERSIVIIIELDQVKMLSGGDASISTEEALLAHGLIGDIDILRAGHHGSNTSTSPVLLNKTTPEIGLISAGKNNKYGHPTPRVIDDLTAMGAKILRTDREGTVALEVSGQQIRIKQKRFPTFLFSLDQTTAD